MRVLHVVPYFPPERPGGVGEYAARLHRALLDAGHESTVLTRGVRSEPGVVRIARSAPGWFLRLGLEVRRAAGYDIVHVHAGEALPLLVGLRLARALGLASRPRVVSTFHVHYAGVAASLAPYRLGGERFGGGLRCLFERSVVATAHRVVDRLAVVLADAVVPITRACAQELLGPERGAVAPVILHGLPDPPPGSAPPPEPVELLYVGTPGHRKRVRALPPVLARVRAECPRARLRIVGFDWDRAPGLREAFAAHGVEDAVECVGFLPADELPAWYRAASVLLVPSAYEGLPLVVVEALHCGLPVVATRVAGHPEAVEDGVNGFLVPLDDPVVFATRCVEILLDPGLHEKLSEGALRVAHERFGLERHVEEYLALYERLRGARA